MEDVPQRLKDHDQVQNKGEKSFLPSFLSHSFLSPAAVCSLWFHVLSPATCVRSKRLKVNKKGEDKGARGDGALQIRFVRYKNNNQTDGKAEYMVSG